MGAAVIQHILTSDGSTGQSDELPYSFIDVDATRKSVRSKINNAAVMFR